MWNREVLDSFLDRSVAYQSGMQLSAYFFYNYRNYKFLECQLDNHPYLNFRAKRKSFCFHSKRLIIFLFVLVDFVAVVLFLQFFLNKIRQ